jgi:hypothetical protein
MSEPTIPSPVRYPLQSHLFTVRLWKEDLGDGRSEWRGQVRDALKRQTRYFRDWQTLSTFLEEQLKKYTAPREKENEENSE